MRQAFAYVGGGLLAAFEVLKSLDFAVLEQLLINFIILGEIPGTSIQITFTALIIGLVIIIWLPAAFAALLWCRDNIIRKIDYYSQLELISL